MFDFAWSELALIGVVALVVIGPKDMPVAVRTVARMVKKARRMAAEFQTHVDDLVREADLQEVRDDLNSIRRTDLNAHLARTIDPDGAIRDTLRDAPHKPSPPAAAPAPETVQRVELQPAHEVLLPDASQGHQRDHRPGPAHPPAPHEPPPPAA